MGKKIAMSASIINVIAVAGFAAMMYISDYGSYLSSIFIAFSFVIMMCAFCAYTDGKGKPAGYAAAGFGVMYATIIVLVYYAQITTVHAGGLSHEAASYIDYQQFGLFFSFDLLGYALMGLATFFAGLTIAA